MGMERPKIVFSQGIFLDMPMRKSVPSRGLIVGMEKPIIGLRVLGPRPHNCDELSMNCPETFHDHLLYVGAQLLKSSTRAWTP